jgi:catechol 2,3-dioxygenase-like lactoylglutathione lyase family enzyme
VFKDKDAFSSFSVSDLREAERFYGQTLGLDVSRPMDQLQLNLRGGGRVFIYQKSDHVPADFTVLNFVVGNVEEAVGALTERGVRFEIYHRADLVTDERGILRGPGPRIAWFKDPAGNVLSVLEET